MGRLPLEGVRILDLTMVWAGPYGTKFPADMGAEVIKIEGPSNFDLIRGINLAALQGQAQANDRPYNKSAYFSEYNRNKLGVTLDLAHPRGRELFLQLTKISDVVIENYRADVLENLGLTYDVLRAVKPDIILVSMPAFGKQGMERDYVGYGPTIEQTAGLATLSGYRDGPPQKTGISYGDPMAGLGAAAAIMAALLYRQRTGKGQYIEVAQRDNMIGVIGEAIMEWGMNRRLPPRMGNRHPWMAPHGCYPCQPLPEEEGRPLARLGSDGLEKATDRWITIAVSSDAEWRGLCEAMGRPDLVEDGRFADALSRYHHQDELDEIIAAWTQQHDDYSLFHLLQSKGVPAGPVLTPLSLTRDPHLEARGFFEIVQHPDMGANKVTRPVWRLTETPVHVRRPAPCFGEHNDYVFRELLGLSEEEIETLTREGVISDAPRLRGAPA